MELDGKSLLPSGDPVTRAECGSNKRGGGICRSTVLYANGRCKLHGGATLNGTNAPSYKHGRYSKYMPEALREKYETAVMDPALTHLRDEIALIDILLGEKLERVQTGESVAVLDRSLNLISEYEKMTNGDAGADGYKGPEPDAILADLRRVLTIGRANFDLFEEIQPILEQRRRMTESENKRLKDLNQTFTAEQAIGFVRQLGDAIKRHVTDPKQVAAIFEDFDRALTR